MSDLQPVLLTGIAQFRSNAVLSAEEDNMTIYQEELKNLLTACERYRRNHIGAEELKNSVWQTARAITNTEEQKLRNFLQQAEGELDMAQFTCEDVFVESLSIVSGIPERIMPMLKKEISDRDTEGISGELNHGDRCEI